MGSTRDSWRKRIAAGALVVAGVTGGGVLLSQAANAADSTTATRAKAAALAEYPGATIQRVETDSDGVYEAHIVTAGGDHVIVQMDASFAVTGTRTGGPGGGHGRGDGTASAGEAAPAA